MKHEYGKLEKKILVRVLIIAAVGLVIWAIIQFLIIDNLMVLPNQITQLPADTNTTTENYKALELDNEQIESLTSIFEQRQKSYLATIGILVLLIVIFYYTMMRLTKYFKESSAGVDKLLDDETTTIALSPELDFMEEKLNNIKNELVKREAEARNSEDRKNELVVYLAHDIRTPLTTIIGYLDFLIKEPDLSLEQKAKHLGIAMESAKRLETLVDQLFEISRFNLQSIQLDIHEFNLTFMLQQLADDFYPVLRPEEKRITVNAPEHLWVKGDPDKLVRVFRNILKNASVFSETGSEIKVEAQENKTNVLVKISNVGSVIPKGELRTIFDKFYRLDNARNVKTGGAGLGLAIAKEIVLAHNGDITATSGDGETEFTISLPNKLKFG